METQHAFEFSFPINSRLQATLHSRGRTQPTGLGPYQARLGPVLEYTFTRHLAVMGGYYFSKQEQSDRDLRGTHRVFGGVEWTPLRARRAEFEVRSLLERFIAGPESFTRWRNRFRLTSTARTAPYVSAETFLDAHGWRSTRYSAGLRIGAARWLDLDVGYFYEPRRATLGGDRHMFLTTVQFRLPKARRTDPDL